MFSVKRCVPGIGLAVCSCVIAVASPPLTTVQDVLYKADGTKFEGIATISWQSFEAVDSTTIPPQTITVRIVDGFVRVQLVPTTNAVTPASYTVVYNSDGKAQFAENWLVPPSNIPVRVRDVRVGGPGSVIGGGSPPAPVTSIQIADVLGLTAALNIRPAIGTGYTPSRAAVINPTGAIDGASGNLSDCLHVDGSSGACGTSTQNPSAGFVDGEVPAGAVDSVNTAFTLVGVPNPPSSLSLFRGGLLLRQGTDYTLNNSSISFVRPPLLTDVLVSSYRVGASISGVTFVDAEIPSGSIDGSNTAFLLTKAPSPAASVALYRNGLRLRMNLDYTLSGSGIIFQSGLAPVPGDTLQCSYRTSP